MNSLIETSIHQVTPAGTVRQISTNATRTRATTVPAWMVWRHSAASVNLDTQAHSVRPTSMSVLASPAEMVAPVRTVKTLTFVAALKAPQVTQKHQMRQLNILFADILMREIFFSEESTVKSTLMTAKVIPVTMEPALTRSTDTSVPANLATQVTAVILCTLILNM